jgi:hypothetical protein
MVFPQAEFEIIPDSQAASANLNDKGSISARSTNPKNPDVAHVLRLLSLDTMDDTQTESETLPTAGNDSDDNGWDQGLDNNDSDTNLDHTSYIYNDDDHYFNLQESQDPTITPSHSAVHGTDLGTQVHGTPAFSARSLSARSISARSISTTIRTTVTVSTDPSNALPPPPIVETPESSSGPPAPNMPTRTSKRHALRLATQDSDQSSSKQPEASPCTDSPGPIIIEVCFVLTIRLNIMIVIKSSLYIILDST